MYSFIHNLNSTMLKNACTQICILSCLCAAFKLLSFHLHIFTCLLVGKASDRERNRAFSCCNIYQSWETSFPKSMCEGWSLIGVQEESGAAEEGSDGGVGVIWSRLKPEQEGLVTEAYLRRRHRGSETVALWENLLQQKRGQRERFEGKERWGDTRRKAESSTRGGIPFWGGTRKTLSVKFLIQNRDGDA